VKPFHRSLHGLWRLRIANQCRNEQLQTPRRYEYTLLANINPPWPIQPLADMSGGIHVHIQHASSVALLLTLIEIFSGLQTVKAKALELRLYQYVCPYCCFLCSFCVKATQIYKFSIKVNVFL